MLREPLCLRLRAVFDVAAVGASAMAEVSPDTYRSMNSARFGRGVAVQRRMDDPGSMSATTLFLLAPSRSRPPRVSVPNLSCTNSVKSAGRPSYSRRI